MTQIVFKCFMVLDLATDRFLIHVHWSRRGTINPSIVQMFHFHLFQILLSLILLLVAGCCESKICCCMQAIQIWGRELRANLFWVGILGQIYDGVFMCDRRFDLDRLLVLTGCFDLG